MLYWPGKKDMESSLADTLLNGNNITAISVVSAYVSDDGIALLERLKAQYNLPKDKIELILSSEFSNQEPADKLERLCRCCQVYVLQDPLLHAKAYWMRGKPSRLVMGSSNLTRGGFDSNIELDEILELNEETERDVRTFFAYCRTRSLLADGDMIAYYRRLEPCLRELHAAQDRARKSLRGYRKSDDPFDTNTYDLADAYFTFSDYECLFPRNQREKSNPDLQAHRRQLQKKMLFIHERIYPQIQRLGVACHRSAEHITSLIRPEPYNLWKVAWMGVRYGKQPWELNVLNAGTETSDEVLGFQKYGCLQFCIGPEAFEINLFLAVRHKAVDREHLHDHLKELSPRIIGELKKLRGQHMHWSIQGGDNGENINLDFDFDAQPPEDFISFFKENDKDGCESFLYLSYPPDDERIKTLDGICKVVTEKLTVLAPLYNAMVYRVPKEFQ